MAITYLACLIDHTPRPVQDLWNLGRCMGIEAFDSSHDKEANKMASQLRAAATKDRKRLSQGNRAKTVLMATVKGDAGVKFESAYRDKMVWWVEIIRKRYAGFVVRRTILSVDNKGSRISGLEPFQEHYLQVELYQHEIQNLETLAQGLLKDGTHRAARHAVGSVSCLPPSINLRPLAHPPSAGLLPIHPQGAPAP
jgi:hypothetical protein